MLGGLAFSFSLFSANATQVLQGHGVLWHDSTEPGTAELAEIGNEEQRATMSRKLGHESGLLNIFNSMLLKFIVYSSTV